MKTISNKLWQVILWYTLITISIGTIIDVISFFHNIFEGLFGEASLFSIFILIEIVFLFSVVKFIRNKITKFAFKLISVFWVAQILLFGVRGINYAFNIGPEIAFFIKDIGHIKFGYFFLLFTNEFSIEINSNNDIPYLGINLIPILISLTLIYLSKKLFKKGDPLLPHESFGVVK